MEHPVDLDTLAKAAGDVRAPAPEALAAGRLRLDAASSAATARVAALRRRRVQRRRWGTGAIVGAAATAVVALVLPLLTAAPASAREVLLEAAAAAGRQVDERADARYWHVASELYYPGTGTFQREIWQARVGSSVLRDEADAALAAEGTGGDLDPALIRTEAFDTAATFVVGGEVLTWKDLDALPTDATALGQLLRDKVRGHASGEDNEVWESVAALLLESPASPQLRSALWQVAANIPGVELIGDATDAAGREGTAIERNELDEGWYSVVYVLDPSDGTLLETRNVEADGTVAFRWTLVDQGPSDTAPAADRTICGAGSESARDC